MTTDEPMKMMCIAIPVQPPLRVADELIDEALHLKFLSDTFKDIERMQLERDRILITSHSQGTIRQLKMMSQEVVESLRRIVNLTQVIGRPGAYTEEFAILTARMGRAIGSGGENIKASRLLDGVISVDNSARFVDAKGFQVFRITAESEEVAKMAREMLEKNSITVKVPHSMAGRIIGSQGAAIQKIVDMSGATQVSVNDQMVDGDSAGTVSFSFTGNGTALLDAKLLVEFIVRDHERMEAVRTECSNRLSTSGGGDQLQQRSNTREIFASTQPQAQQRGVPTRR